MCIRDSVGPEHLPERPMQEMGRRMITPNALAPRDVDAELYRITRADHTARHRSAMHDEARLRLQRVLDAELAGRALDHALITHLTARFAVERRQIRDQLAGASLLG